MLSHDHTAHPAPVNRRQVVLGTAAFATAFLSVRGRASIFPLGQTAYGAAYRAAINNPVRVTQQCAEWCWAASISMIFATHGHVVDQKVFVQALYGSPFTCAPSGQAINIAKALSSSWIDSTGEPFQSSVTAAYDPAWGVFAINNAIIVEELANNRPLLYCNEHHAMVVVQADYILPLTGIPVVTSVGVLDPWPYSPGFHLLSPPETVAYNLGGQMTFLASVQTT